MARKGTALILLALMGGVSALLLVPRLFDDADPAAAKDVSSEHAQEVPVIVEPVTLAAERARVVAVGTSRALRSVELHPATAGEVVAVEFTANERVKASETLIELDARDERLAVKLARVRVNDTSRLLSRYLRTGDSGAVSPTTIDSARRSLEEARIERARAEVALDDRTIEAPFTGYIGITEVDVGDRIGPETMIATLDDRSILSVSFEVPEAFLDQIAIGDDVSVGLWSERGLSRTGEIVEIDSRIDPISRTFVARAHIDNREDRLRPGMSFRVGLELDGVRYPIVPEVAVQWGGDGPYVWAAKDGTARRVGITIVQRRKGQVLLDADLAVGQRVVVEGVQRMREGIAVRRVDPDTLVADDGVTVHPR